MEINHAPVFDRKKAISYYENKDGVSIKYVCTTEWISFTERVHIQSLAIATLDYTRILLPMMPKS